MKSVLAIRQAVRPWVQAAEARILIGVSGGADSMALAIATQIECKAEEIELIAIVIDHQLQEGSDSVALNCAQQLRAIGLTQIEIVAVTVKIEDGMESSARRARYEAFESAIVKYHPDFFLLAHTKNDQAESVLLGLARGSGTRSLSGMAEVNGLYVRPLLEIDRGVTEAACAESGVIPWIDPHNSDLHYARVRVRSEILPILESSLGPGVIDALARSARILREDADALDSLAESYLSHQQAHSFEIVALAELEKAIRARVLRAAIYAAGAPEGSITTAHLAPIEALITNWHGQGAISLPGGVKVERISGRLSLST